MAKGIVTSFRVEAASNGYTLSYTVRTKQPMAAGQSYCNTDYREVNNVYKEGDEASLLAEIKKLCGVIDDGADAEASDSDDPVLAKEA